MTSHLFLLSLLGLPGPAIAGYKLLQNDGFTNHSTVAVQKGFIDGECWGVTYVPDPGDYPFEWVHVDAIIGGTTGHAMFDIRFYELSDTNISGATTIDSSAIYLNGSNTAFQRIDLDDPKLEVSLPTVESGNVAVAMCLNGHDGVPAIARDTDGMAHANRNYLYASGMWLQSNLYGLTGDWIQRLCIETDNVSGDECDVTEGDTDADADADTDTDTDADADTDTDTDTDTADTYVPVGDLTLDSIVPAEMDYGVPIDVVLLGTGFESGIDARIGGISLTGITVEGEGTLSGRTPSSLPEGTHDVEVVLDGDNAYLPAAFSVLGEEEGGCTGCASGGIPAGLGLLGAGLFSLGMAVSRRRQD